MALRQKVVVALLIAGLAVLTNSKSARQDGVLETLIQQIKSQHFPLKDVRAHEKNTDIPTASKVSKGKSKVDSRIQDAKIVAHEKQKMLMERNRGHTAATTAKDILYDHRLKMKQSHKADVVEPKNQSEIVNDILNSMSSTEPTKHRAQKPVVLGNIKKSKPEMKHPSTRYADVAQSKKSQQRPRHPYIEDGKPKHASDTSFENITISHSLDGDKGTVHFTTHGKSFEIGVEKSSLDLSKISMEIGGIETEESESIRRNLQNYEIYSNKYTGATFLANKTDSLQIVVGKFSEGQHDYHLQQPPKSSDKKHIVKRTIRSTREKEDIDRVLRAVDVDSVMRRRRKRDAALNAVDANIEVSAMTDLSMWEYHYIEAGRDTQQGVLHLTTYLVHIFNLMNLRYANIQNPQLIIKVTLSDIKIAMNSTANRIYENQFVGNGQGVYGDLLLDDLRSVVRGDYLVLQSQIYDHLMAFSYLDLFDSESNSDGLLGIAYMSGVCNHGDGLAVSVVEATPYNIEETVNTAAHELGHNLGAAHDNSVECQGDAGWIMGAYSSYPNPLFFYFSCCSQRDFMSTLLDGRECVNTHYYENIVPSYLNGENAGDIYTSDYLCNAVMGTAACGEWVYNDNNLEFCEGLWCESPTTPNSCVSSGFVPPHGTPCGSDRWCMETKCVHTSHNQTSLYQGPDPMCDLSVGECNYGYLQCTSGSMKWSSSESCYDSSWRCDGEEDCQDSSDEFNCGCTDQQFSCGSDDRGINHCVQRDMLCDNVTDCFNGHDEFNCTRECPPQYSRCESGPSVNFDEGLGSCYPTSSVCNGEIDCMDYSDEFDCECDNETLACQSPHHTRVTLCLSEGQICDGHPHCLDAADEQNCTCSDEQFSCANGLGCIWSSWVCDFERDCSDWSDELNCECPANSIGLCGDGSACLYDGWICDGWYDCYDGGDEADCDCSIYNQIQCATYNSTYNKCIDPSYLCDNYTDCLDNSDETICEEPCPDNYTSCANGLASDFSHNLTMNPSCIPQHQLCDFKSDCMDGSDEMDCSCQQYGMIECNATAECIPEHWLCDGYQDCSDNEDEMDCPCPANTFECSSYNETYSKCVDIYSLCDGMADCLAGDDEDMCDDCQSNETRCNWGSIISEPYGACTPNDTVCDGKINCLDLSDELNCTTEEACDSDTAVMRCLGYANATYDWLPQFICLDNSSICDGYHDCIDGLDEMDCPCGDPSEFKCASGAGCIPSYWVCDGMDDCWSGEDEVDCPCDTNEFQCSNSSNCIPIHWACDGEIDCYSDGSDEAMCNDTCLANEARCDWGVNIFTQTPCYNESLICDDFSDCYDSSDEYHPYCNESCDGVRCLLDEYSWEYSGYRSWVCLNNSLVCDGFSDCKYGEDEASCPCSGDQYRCPVSGNCIPQNWICDNWVDCQGGEDEQDCGCSDGGIVCPGTSECIPESWLCDGMNDCFNGTDELYCDSCGFEMFNCTNGTVLHSPALSCIPENWLCDGYADCSDYSDESEEFCQDFCYISEDRPSYRCADKYDERSFFCFEETTYETCNGIEDCANGEDEYMFNCTARPACSGNQFQCSDGRCIPESWVCDNYNDCNDSIDEIGCENSQNCLWDGKFACPNGSCITVHQMCDGVWHCDDGSDESNCNTTCPQGYERCETGATRVAVYYGWNGPWNCYNANWTSCRRSVCGDSSDMKNCSCAEIAEGMYSYYDYDNTTEEATIKCNFIDELGYITNSLCFEPGNIHLCYDWDEPCSDESGDEVSYEHCDNFGNYSTTDSSEFEGDSSTVSTRGTSFPTVYTTTSSNRTTSYNTSMYNSSTTSSTGASPSTSTTPSTTSSTTASTTSSTTAITTSSTSASTTTSTTGGTTPSTTTITTTTITTRNASVQLTTPDETSTSPSSSMTEVVTDSTVTHPTTFSYEWEEPEAWSSNRLYPYGEEQGDTDLMASDDIDYWMCKEVKLNGKVGAAFFNKRYTTLYICNNGLLTFNLEWRLYYPSVFGTDSWFDDVAIMTPFWGEAGETLMSLLADEFPDARTKVFYKTYEMSLEMDAGTETILTRAKEDVKNSAYAVSGFEPSWVLVVTWLNLPADQYYCDWSAVYHKLYGSYIPEFCIDVAKRSAVNHFQAVFITDGVYSFVKFNYPEDGINWAYPGIDAQMSEDQVSQIMDNAYGMGTMAVAGYNSGDKYLGVDPTYTNINISNSLAMVDIDRLPGNLVDGRDGEWLFRVEKSSGAKNAEVECQQWVTQQALSLPLYLWYNTDTPCPQNLWQMFWDPGYEWLGWEAESSACYQTVFSEIGLKQSCCYTYDWDSDDFSALVVGAPYGGHIIDTNNITSEAYGYSKCCVETTNMCKSFYKVRPFSDGENYEAPSVWPWFGDPHIITSDGLSYTFNGLGEYLFSRIGDIVTIQARTERVLLSDGGLGQATYFSAICIDSLSRPRVQAQVNKNAQLGSTIEDQLQLIIGESKMDISLIEQDGNSSKVLDGVDSNILFKRTNSSLTISYSTGVTVTVSVANKMLTITLGMPSKFKGRTIGLTGIYDDDQSNDFTFLNGTAISTNSSESELFAWASTFALSVQDSLMYYEDGEDWYTYNKNSFVPVFTDDEANWVWSSESFKQSAYETCGDDSACLYDIFVTGDIEIGASSKATSASSVEANAALNNFAPSLFGEDSVFITVGEEFTYAAHVNDSNGDQVTVSTNVPSTITKNGDQVSIKATITNATGFHLTISAKDPAGAVSVKTPLAMICSCANGGTCQTLSLDDQEDVEESSVVLNCICPAGYTGDTCETDLDACALVASPCYPSVICKDLPPPANSTGYTCGACPAGYSGDGKSCFDIDECLDDNCHQFCINSPGSFVCACSAGYVLNEDGYTCDDVDECSTLSPCHHLCNNTDGSYSCSCDSGFQLLSDNKNCEPANPCQNPSPCDDTNGYCNIADDGSETCSCKRGYILSAADGSTCEEMDECALGIDACDQTCHNTVGGYTCSCSSGYTLASDSMSCKDVNECLKGTHNCSTSQTCVNAEGSFKCTCASGKVFNNGVCEAVVFTNPVAEVSDTPTVEASQNSVKFSLGGITIEEYTVEKEYSLFELIASAASDLCQDGSCDMVKVESEAKRRRRKRSASITFYKEYFARLPGYPQTGEDGDLLMAIYSLVPGSGVLPSTLLKQALTSAKTDIESALGATMSDVQLLYVPLTQTTEAEEQPIVDKDMSPIYIGLGAGLGLALLILVAVFVIIKIKAGTNTKTVYPTSDPEFSRRCSEPRKDPEKQTLSEMAPVDMSAAPVAVVPTKSVHQPTRPISAGQAAKSQAAMDAELARSKQTQEHDSRAPSRDSTTPVDAEGQVKY